MDLSLAIPQFLELQEKHKHNSEQVSSWTKQESSLKKFIRDYMIKTNTKYIALQGGKFLVLNERLKKEPLKPDTIIPLLRKFCEERGLSSEIPDAFHTFMEATLVANAKKEYDVSVTDRKPIAAWFPGSKNN